MYDCHGMQCEQQMERHIHKRFADKALVDMMTGIMRIKYTRKNVDVSNLSFISWQRHDTKFAQTLDCISFLRKACDVKKQSCL